MDGNDLEKATQLKDSGKISDEFALKYATDGVGTNEELIKKTFEGKTKDEIEALKKTYKEKYGKDLDTIINSEVSGRDGFEIGQLMKGKPQTPQEMIDRANEAYEFERGSGSNWFSNGATDLLTGSNSGAVLDRQHQRINDIAEQAQQNGGQFTDEQKARLGTLTEYQGMDVKNYQTAKDSATNALATGAAVVVGAAVSIASAGTLSAPVVAALSALIGGASSMAVKGVMLEGGYALEDIGIDAITTLASAASAGLIKLPGLDSQLNKLVGIADPTKATVFQSFMKGGISGTLKGGIDSTASGLMNEQNYQGDFGDFLKGMGGQVGTGMAGGFLSGGVGAGIGTAMGPGPQGGDPSYAWAALKGGASGMGGAAAANLINPAAYSGRPEDIAKQWLTVVGQAGVTGALDSVAETRGEIKKANAAKAKAEAETQQNQPADDGPSQKAATEEADPAQKKQTQPTTEETGARDDVSDVKAKVDAEQQGKTPATSPEDEVAKLKTQAEADKAAANAPKPETNQTPVDPAEVKQPLSPQEAYDLAKKANYKPKKGQDPDPVRVAEAEAAKAELAKRLPELLAAQSNGRSAPTEDGQALQTQRQAFEMALAHSPEVAAAIKPTLDLMCEKAFDYLAKMHGNDLGKAIGKLGVDPSSGLAGAVGTDPDVMLKVLAEGNVRERAIALASFQKLLAKQALAGPNADGLDGIAQLRAAFGGEQQSGSFGTADIDRLEAHVNALKKDTGKTTFSPDDDWKALAMLAPKDGPHQAFTKARGEGHDTKLPSLPEDVVQAQLGDKPAQKGTKLSGAGEESALSRTKMTLEQAIDAGINLSDAEIDAAVANGGVMPWNDGTVANILKPDAPFIAGANNAAMPLKAGISGTTFRLMNSADVLGVDPAMARLIAMSQLIGINAHSFHEIASASQGFQSSDSQYSPSNPYTPASTGLSDAQLMALMLRNGMLPSDLNKPVQSPPPTQESR